VVTAMIGELQRQELLRIARASIVARVNREKTQALSDRDDGPRPTGVFVTLHQHGALRGCIGQIDAGLPLAQAVSICAAAACSADPRFVAVTPMELPAIDIEISVLGPLQSVDTLSEIEIGRHGLVVELGSRRGLLLPQVATEQDWDARTFVEQTCRKAGLPPDVWPGRARLWKFEAEVFGEGETSD
jgi:AmmeMemoRadiSam system protein A